MNDFRDLNISGLGTVSGGKFRKVEISGLGKINGDIEAEDIEISGKGTIEGNAKALRKISISGSGRVIGDIISEKISSSGTANVDGNVEGKYLDCTGNFTIDGSVKVTDISVEGRLKAYKDIKAQKIECQGYLSVGGDIATEDFYSKGSFTIEGLLNANKINIEIYGFGRVKEIGGEEIVVSKGMSNPLGFLNKFVSQFLGNEKEIDKLTADLIEGTTISLRDTKAKIVRGGNIKIGPGCEIGELEYSESFEVDPSSSVRSVYKV